MKKCNHCGADVPEEEGVCPACGQEVTEETASAEEPTEQTASEETAAQTDSEAESFTCEEEPETDGAEQTEDGPPMAIASRAIIFQVSFILYL